MLGLNIQPDGSAVEAAIKALVEELNKLARIGSGGRGLVHTRCEGKLHPRKPERHSGAARAYGERGKRSETAANRLVTYVASAGRVAGFDVNTASDN